MARSFTGAADLAQNTAIPNVAQTGSMVFWINPAFNSGDSTDRFILSWVKTGSVSVTDGRIQIERFSDNNMYVGANKVDAGLNDDRLVFADTGIFISGTWAQHTLTWNEPATTTQYLVNGIVKGTTSVQPSHAFTVACTIAAIGNTPSGWSSNAVSNSTIADAAFYNVVLSAGEIQALSKGARPYSIRPGSLKGYWPLDGLQSPEPDLSGFANNGTLTGTAKASGPPITPFTPRWHRFLGWTPALPAAGLGWIINRRNKLMVPKKRA